MGNGSRTYIGNEPFDSPLTSQQVGDGIITGLKLADGVAVNLPVRQTVLSSALDANGYAGAISAGAGLNFNVSASPTPLVMAFASGFDFPGGVDYIAKLTASATNQGSLVANNTNFLHATWVTRSSVTWGQTLVPPDYGYAFDKTRGALMNFEGTNGATTTTDDFGNAWTLNSATITTAQFKFGASSLDCTGGSKNCKTTAFTNHGDGSWEASVWFRINATPGSGSDAMLFHFVNAGLFGAALRLNNTAGTIKLALDLSSNGTSQDIANGSLGSNTTWTLSQWNKVRMVFDALAGTYRVYLSLNGAAETQDISVSSTSRVCSTTQWALGSRADNNTLSSFNGWFDAFRFIRAATVTTTETPSGVAPAITDYPYHFFSIPEMKMYEVTAASASSGTNPTLTQRNRLFVGEADTGAATVSAVRNYALRGQYRSAETTMPASGSRTTFSHNIGTTFVNGQAWGRNYTTSNGVVAGEIHPLRALATASQLPYDPIIIASRNSAILQAGSDAAILGFLSSTGTSIGTSTNGNWKITVDVERAF